MNSTTCNNLYLPPYKLTQQLPRVTSTIYPCSKIWGRKKLCSQTRRLKHFPSRAITAAQVSPWDEKPYEVLEGGKVSYLDEQDVVAFLDPPKELIPLEPDSYNPAVYLWKKIEDIPEERRHKLLSLLNPRLISRAWEIAGTRYDNPTLLGKKCGTDSLCGADGKMLLEFYSCRSGGGHVDWMKSFKKALFRCNSGKIFGRLISESVLSRIANTSSPLYFMVTQDTEVMSTEQPCDFAYEFGDGQLDLHNHPQDFPKPAKHPCPFDDQAIIYVRHIGPGVLVGQAWQEGKELQQVPRKLCGEILMVKNFAATREYT